VAGYAAGLRIAALLVAVGGTVSLATLDRRQRRAAQQPIHRQPTGRPAPGATPARAR
jgi:hypothetical protein